MITVIGISRASRRSEPPEPVPPANLERALLTPLLESLCFSRESPHRQILHPMPFTDFWDFPIFQKSGKSDNPKIGIFGSSGLPEFRFEIPKIRVLGNPNIRIFRFPEFQFSKSLDFRKSEKPAFRVSGNPDVEFPETYPDTGWQSGEAFDATAGISHNSNDGRP